MVFSDCFGDVDQSTSALRLLRRRGHDVMVFQVLAPEEQTSSLSDTAVFEDLEQVRAEAADQSRTGAAPLLGTLRRLPAAVEERVREDQLRPVSAASRTDGDLGDVLVHFLSSRAARRKARSDLERNSIFKQYHHRHRSLT